MITSIKEKITTKRSSKKFLRFPEFKTIVQLKEAYDELELCDDEVQTIKDKIIRKLRSNTDKFIKSLAIMRRSKRSSINDAEEIEFYLQTIRQIYNDLNLKTQRRFRYILREETCLMRMDEQQTQQSVNSYIYSLNYQTQFAFNDCFLCAQKLKTLSDVFRFSESNIMMESFSLIKSDNLIQKCVALLNAGGGYFVINGREVQGSCHGMTKEKFNFLISCIQKNIKGEFNMFNKQLKLEPKDRQTLLVIGLQCKKQTNGSYYLSEEGKLPAFYKLNKRFLRTQHSYDQAVQKILAKPPPELEFKSRIFKRAYWQKEIRRSQKEQKPTIYQFMRKRIKRQSKHYDLPCQGVFFSVYENESFSYKQMAYKLLSLKKHKLKMVNDHH